MVINQDRNFDNNSKAIKAQQMLEIIEDESQSEIIEQVENDLPKKEPTLRNQDQSSAHLSQIIAQQE